jgi:hypothetical protein
MDKRKVKDLGLYGNYYCLLVVPQCFGFVQIQKLSIFNYIEVTLSKVTYFHIQFKNHNAQIMNNKHLIRWVANSLTSPICPKFGKLFMIS